MAPFLLLIILFALAWVLLILPKQREMKRHNELVASLRVGERVMTGSGFYGTLTEVGPDTVRLELAPDLEVTVARRAVAARVDEPPIDVATAAGAGEPEALEDAPGALPADTTVHDAADHDDDAFGHDDGAEGAGGPWAADAGEDER